MDGIEQKLGAILSDPASMSKIMELAKGLGLNSAAPDGASTPTAAAESSPDPAPAAAAPTATTSPMAGLGALLSSIGNQAPDDKQTALLKALRPYLRPERQDRLDRAIQTAKMVKTAKQAMKQFMP